MNAIIWTEEFPEDLTREPFCGGEQWVSNGRILAKAEYPLGETSDSARSAGLFVVVFDDIGIYK